MKKSKERSQIRPNRGITLIALVITIIVLLILAGVSLNLIAGSDGILKKAADAVEKYNESSEKEQEELAQAESWMNQYFPEEESDKSIVRQVKAEHYGDSVNYSVEVNGVTLDDWKIFYNDGKQVAMILGGYLPNSTNVAAGAGLVQGTNDEMYGVRGSHNVGEFINILTNPSLWNSLVTSQLSQKGAKANGTIDLQTWVASWNTNEGYTKMKLEDDSIGKTEDRYCSSSIEFFDDPGCEDELYFPKPEKDYWSSTLHVVGECVHTIGKGVIGNGRNPNDIVRPCEYDYTLRPVIFLPASVLGEKIDGVWNIE